MMPAPHDPSFTLTLLKPPGCPQWEIQCEGESMGTFDSLNEALATARTMAANWLGEAESVRLTGGDYSAIFIDEHYSRAVPRTADNDPG